MSKILIVEDNAESRYLLERLLESRGHNVITAENGEDALRLARQDPPEVIISDIMMPVMNGFRLCREVKSDPRLRNIPFIFYTATFVEKSDEKLAMSLGASRFIVKPTEGEQFIKIFDEVVDEHQQGILQVPEGPLEGEDVLLEMYDNSIARKLAETVEKLQDERKALIKSEQRLKEAQELAHIGHWELDLKSNSLLCSDEIYRILGLKPQEFDAPYEAFMAAVHPDDKAYVTRAHEESLAKKTACDIEYRVLLKDGTIKYVNEKFQTIYDDNGMPTCSIGTVQDITERKQAEVREQHLNTVLRSIRDVNQLIVREKRREPLIQAACHNLVRTRGFQGAWIVLTDRLPDRTEGAQAGFGDDSLTSITGRIREGRLPVCFGRGPSEGGVMVTDNPTTECGDCPFVGAYGKGIAMTVALNHDSLKYGWLGVSVPAEFATYNEEESLLAEIASDIAFALHGIETEEELKKSERTLRAIFESARDGILLADAELGRLVLANDAICEMLGYSFEEIKSLSVADIHPVEDFEHVRSQFEMQARGEITLALDIAVKRKDGSVFPADVSLSPLELEGHPYLLGIFRDITERKQAEEEHEKLQSQLQQAQKMEAIGTLAGGIAHDFNNILGAIIGYTEIADLQVPEESKAKESLKEVLNAGRRAKDLVKQILAFSRKGEQERIPIQIGPIAKEALKLLRSSIPTTIEIRQNIESDTGIVEADPTQIHQILMNLCTNASHAMREEGGILEVGVRNVEIGSWDSESGYFELTPGPYLLLSVSDTGQGMTPEVLERIFEPYFTTKEKGQGTGLGLSVVHGIVKDYGGTIRAYSELGKGSTFNVYLPVIQEKAEAPETDEIAPIPTGNEHILFIDDEPALVEIGKQMLERLGYRVTTRTSSMEALELFKSKPDQFDLVITDMTMPYMTGEKLAGELMNIRSDIPVIICTGFSMRISEENIKALGIKAFVMKPIVMRNLADTVREVLSD